MEVFVTKINQSFSIMQVSKLLKKPYPLIHRSIKPLMESKFIKKDSHEMLSLDLRQNHAELAYIESIKTREFLDKHKIISLFAKDVSERMKLRYIILLVFGSYAENRQKEGSDIDIMAIIEHEDQVTSVENAISSLASSFSKKFDINVVSVKSACEMLAKRSEANMLNESLDKHIILLGAENYYRVLKDVIG